MKIDLRELSEGVNRLDLAESAQELDLLGSELEFPDPIEVKLTLIKSGDSFLIRGDVFFQVRASCCRCLEKFEEKITSELNLVFQRESRNSFQKRERFPDEELNMIGYDDIYIDLKEAVREVVLLELPMKPLCSEDCAGLCPICGENLNHSTCRCEEKAIDPRWEALQKLRG